MATKLEPVYRLKCSCNEYDWGKQGSESVAARLCESQPGWGDGDAKNNFRVNQDKPYAEMWMGTYPELPSYVADTDEDLQAVLDRHASELVGEEVVRKFGHSNLPFLPKVLSISKALPLQLHPNTRLAAKLHEQDPDNFTDPNHKPEIALALTEFEAFCGFKPLVDIARLLELESLQQFVPGRSVSDFTNEQLKEVVRNMLKASEATVRETYHALTKTPETQFGHDTYIPRLAPRLADQYTTTDPGILVALITMNYLVLQPGESIYIPADGIHAYLAGDIIECMARSNNVLNTGFCPRASRNSVDLFCSCLTFTPHSAEESMLRPRPYDGARQGKTQLYSPPMSEFDMLQTELQAHEQEVLGAVGGPSILLVTKGSGGMKARGKSYNLNEGAVFFVAPGVEMEFESETELLLHTAFVEGGTR